MSSFFDKLAQGKKRAMEGLEKASDKASSFKDSVSKTVSETASDLKEKFPGKDVEWKIFKGTIDECEGALMALELSDADFEVHGTCSIGADEMTVTIRLKG